AVTQIQGAGITPADHPLTRQLEQSAQQTVTALQQYQGAAFDRAHMNSQVQLHQYALNTIDNFLLPSARSSRVRNLLQENRAIVQGHLEQARQVLNGLPPQ